MTAGGAGATRFSLDEIQGQIPFAEGDRVRDQFGVLPGMDHVADFAPFAAVFPVDMNIMQVFFSVPEPCRIGGRGEPEQVAVVTAETELEFSIIVGDIKIGRVGLDQELFIRRPVRIVAARTLAVPDGAVEDGLVFLDQVLVAAEAEIHAGFRQELRGIARVGRMT